MLDAEQLEYFDNLKSTNFDLYLEKIKELSPDDADQVWRYNYCMGENLGR